MSASYTVRAASCKDELVTFGAAVEQPFATAEDARAYARRLLTDEYHHEEEPLGYAQVLRGKTVIADYFRFPEEK